MNKFKLAICPRPFVCSTTSQQVADEHSLPSREPFEWLVDPIKQALSLFAQTIEFRPDGQGGANVFADTDHIDDIDEEGWFFTQHGLYLLWYWCATSRKCDPELIRVELNPSGQTWTILLAESWHQEAVEDALENGIMCIRSNLDGIELGEVDPSRI